MYIVCADPRKLVTCRGAHKDGIEFRLLTDHLVAIASVQCSRLREIVSAGDVTANLPAERSPMHCLCVTPIVVEACSQSDLFPYPELVSKTQVSSIIQNRV